MGDDKVRKMAEEALNRLSAELQAGQSDALRNYLAAMGRFHRYSWGNVLLINSQRPDAHKWPDSIPGTTWDAGSKKARRAS